MRKRGRTINHRVTLKPLGMKDPRYERKARAALVAIQHNVFLEKHLVDLYVLADICQRLSDERYIKVHSASVKNLIEQAYKAGRVERLEYAAIEPSADVLLQFFAVQKNLDIARVSLNAAKQWKGKQ